MAAIWVKLKNPSEAFFDLPQSITIAGQYPKEVQDTVRIKYGISIGALAVITEAEAATITAALNAKAAEVQAHKDSNAAKKAEFASGGEDADSNNEPDATPDLAEEQRVFLMSKTVKELLGLVTIIGQDPDDYKKFSKVQLVDWLLVNTSGNWITASKQSTAYCGLPTNASHLYLYTVTDVQNVVDITNNYLATLSSPADDAIMARITDAATAWDDAGNAFNHSTYCALITALIEGGFVD